MRRSMQLKAAHACLRYHLRHSSSWRNAAIIRPRAFLSHLLRDQWREIAGAPRDREIELAMIDGGIITCAGPCLRHGAV